MKTIFLKRDEATMKEKMVDSKEIHSLCRFNSNKVLLSIYKKNKCHAMAKNVIFKVVSNS